MVWAYGYSNESGKQQPS